MFVKLIWISSCPSLLTTCFDLSRSSSGLSSADGSRNSLLWAGYLSSNSDGDVKPGGPLGAFREEQAMSWHRVSPSPFLSSSSHRTQLHYTNSYTYSHPNFNFLQYTIQILVPTRNVVCPCGAWIENRPHSTPSIRLARNPKHLILQWVGIGTHTFSLLFNDGHVTYYFWDQKLLPSVDRWTWFWMIIDCRVISRLLWGINFLMFVL